MREQLRAAGEAMFEPHPSPGDLRRYAQAGDAALDAPVRRHLEACATCHLEVETWRRMGAPGSRAPGAPRGWARVARPALFAAAGVILGVLVTLQLRPSDPTGRQGDAPSDSPVIPGTHLTPPLRQPILHFLPGLLRDGAVPRQLWTLDPDDPYVSVAVPVTLPASVPPTERFRFELRRAGAEPIWSTEMTASRIREHLDAAEVVSLAVVVTAPLEAGMVEFQVVSAEAPGAAPIYRAEIEIAYRQSPAATNAPQ